MKLRFYARPGYMCSMPGPKVQGTAPRYIGRARPVVEEKQINNPATREPAVIESTTPEGKRVMRQMLCDAPDYPLWPADRETAQACGVPYVDVELQEGEWQPKSLQQQPKAPKAGKGEVS